MNTDQRPLAKPTVQVENDRVIVTEWRFPPGSHTGWHRHNHDYVVVPVTTGELHIFDGKTTVPAPLRAGVSYARQIGVEHDVINPNSFEFVFVEIELKPAQGWAERDPAAQGACMAVSQGKAHMSAASGPARIFRPRGDRSTVQRKNGLSHGN